MEGWRRSAWRLASTEDVVLLFFILALVRPVYGDRDGIVVCPGY